MDIQHLVDRLEDLIDVGRHVPMSRFTMIDEERALELIDQMRISIPEQIEKATRIVNQRDQLIARANEDATHMIDMAREQREELVNRDTIVQSAKHRADGIISQANLEAERIRDEADGYVMDVLKELESHLLRTLTIVRNGITKLVQDREIRSQSMTQLQQQQQQAVEPVVPPIAVPQPLHVEQDELVDAE